MIKRHVSVWTAVGMAFLAGIPAAAGQAAHEHSDDSSSCAPATGAVPRGCSIEQHLLAILRRDGVGSAMAELDRMAASDADLRRDAHSYAHAIGIAAYTGQEDVGRVFSQCTPAYQSGCYHGVIQSYFTAHAGDHGGQLSAGFVNALCADQRSGGNGAWLLFQCAHGLGHGLAMTAGHHLPTALSWCDLVDEPWERESCYGGVFMENVVNATMPHHATGRPNMDESTDDPHADHDAMMTSMSHEEFPALKADDPFYPCTVLDSRYQAACYQMQTSAILYFNRQDVAATARLCTTAPAPFRSTCFQSLGRDISSITLQNHARAMRLCATAPPEYQPWCHIGYTKNLVDVTADPNDGFRYCRLLPAGEAKNACYVAVGEEIWVLGPNERERMTMCQDAEPEFVDACRYGAGIAEDRKPTASVPDASRTAE